MNFQWFIAMDLTSAMSRQFQSSPFSQVVRAQTISDAIRDLSEVFINRLLDSGTSRSRENPGRRWTKCRRSKIRSSIATAISSLA
jgi:hypothetical protein